MQQVRTLAHGRRHPDAVSQQNSLVARPIGDDVEIGRHVGIALDQPANGGRKTGRQSTGGEHCDFLFGHGDPPCSQAASFQWLRWEWMRQACMAVK
jgi:hypothetical protein